MRNFLTVYLFLTFSECHCKQDNLRLNLWADGLISDVVRKFKSTDREFIPVADFREEMVEILGKIPVKRGLLAVEGVLGEMTSLKRRGNLKTSQSEEFLMVELPMDFSKLGVHFDNCIFWCGGDKSTDELDIKVPVYDIKSNVSVKLKLLIKNKQCFPDVISVKISKFNNLDIILQNVCISKMNEISEWATHYFNTQITLAIETILKKEFSEVLKNHTFC